jgi:hypothetical protein
VLNETGRFATYVEGRCTINETMRESFIKLLQKFLEKLGNVEFELKQPIANEPDYICKEMKGVIIKI